ncbi:hypothetical protein KJ590_02535 [Patescibacteria group bacterium]|nr:hypothetical protein [Patescibacteria group bacterium]
MEYYNKNKFANFPKKPVKTFQDLEVYQQALAANVFVVNFIVRSASEVAPVFDKRSPGDKKKISAGDSNEKLRTTSEAGRSTSGNVGTGTAEDIKKVILNTLANCACSIPHLIAEAHSFRFGTQKECLILLERVMLNCNKMVVYLDQTRDICATGLEVEKFEELQKKYMLIRRKVLNLQRSWQKYMGMPAGEKIIRDVRL